MSERTHPCPRRPCSTSYWTSSKCKIEVFPFLKWNTFDGGRKKEIWGKKWRLMKARTILPNRGISGLITLFCSSFCDVDTLRMKGFWANWAPCVNPIKWGPICLEPVTGWRWPVVPEKEPLTNKQTNKNNFSKQTKSAKKPVVPEKEPLAGFFNVLLSAPRQDLAHFCLHLAQVHLHHMLLKRLVKWFSKKFTTASIQGKGSHN